MIVEFDDVVFELVPGNFIVVWFSVEKLFEIINVQSSFSLLRLDGRRFGRCHGWSLIEG
jgi:hypothetical protein